MTSPTLHRAWAEIDLNALRSNLHLIRRKAQGNPALMAIVKAGAYGHGLEQIAESFEHEPITFFGVANSREARRIQQTGSTKFIYLLGPTLPHEREEIIAEGWIACLSNLDEAHDFNELARKHNKKALIHIAVDTGMGRGGFLPDDLCAHPEAFLAFDHLIIDGLGSHLAAADSDPEFTQKQIDRFERSYAALKPFYPLTYRHLANSSGLDYTIPCANLIRPGLLLYGYNATTELPAEGFFPAFALKSRITAIRKLPAGHTISYGHTYTTEKDTLVATIGIGYGDGYPRQLSNKNTRVWAKDSYCPLLGRVTMDQIMIDISHLTDINVGDEVELMGPHIPLQEIAQATDTIVWHILTGIGPRVERIYLNQ